MKKKTRSLILEIKLHLENKDYKNKRNMFWKIWQQTKKSKIPRPYRLVK